MLDLGGGVYERNHVAERKREKRREEKEKERKRKSPTLKNKTQLSFQRNPSSGGPGAWGGSRDWRKPIEKNRRGLSA